MAQPTPTIAKQGGSSLRSTLYKDAFERARYEVELVDLAKWFSPEQLARASQQGYAHWMAPSRRSGHEPDMV